jgi:diguanylate cyclase (GGDEF)-like protein
MPPTLPTILIVDDDPTLVQMMGQMLTNVATIRFATSGEAAIKQVQREKPDLILMDAEMPGMSGFDACLAIKAQAELEDVPVLFVTSHHELDFEIRGFAVGGADFIHKPVSAPVLCARVSTHLRLKRATDELRRLALTDALTDLPNRRSFDAALASEWARASREGQPLSTLMVDVDRFKQFNDHYGHPAGDLCLRAVSAALETVMRRPGDLIARYGGEEFAAILPNSTVEGACLVGERLVAAVQALAIPHEHGVVDGVVSVSVGIASGFDGSPAVSAQTSADSASALMQRADQALYMAKMQGRARIWNADRHPAAPVDEPPPASPASKG